MPIHERRHFKCIGLWSTTCVGISIWDYKLIWLVERVICWELDCLICFGSNMGTITVMIKGLSKSSFVYFTYILC